MKQTSIEDCGPTCLYMLLRYYGGYEKLEAIKKLCKTTKEGTTLYHLKEGAEKLGFRAIPYHVEASSLLENFNSPFIAHVLVEQKYYHYIIVYKIKNNTFFIADSKEGKTFKMGLKAFKEIYLDSILVVEPIQIERRKKEGIPKWLFQVFRNFKGDLFKILFYFISTFLLEMICLYSFYFLLTLFKNQNIHLLQRFVVFLIFLFLFKSILDYFGKRKIILCNEKIYICLKQKFESWIFSLPYHEVKVKNSMELFLKLESLEKVLEYFFQILFFLLLEALPFLSVIFLFFHHTKILLLSLFYVVIHLCILICIGRKKRGFYLKLKEENNQEKRDENEVLSSISSICEMQLGTSFLNRQKKHEEEFSYKRSQKNISYLKWETFEETFTNLSQLSLFYFLFSLSSTAPFSLENGILVFYLLAKMKTFLKGVVELYLKNAEIKWSIENMTMEVEREDAISAQEIFLQNARYPYFGNIRNVSFKMKKGKPILLLGKSGIGKSTLAHILMGEYKSGQRFIEGKKSASKVKGSFVSADAMIYTTTILENVMLERNIEVSKLEEILSLTHVDKLIEKHKYFPLLERGENLSSGEKQKVILARALVEDFDVLVLDEALNRLDQQEEMEIMSSILKKYKDKMIFVISHRYNLVDLFPSIYTFTPHGQLKKWKGREKRCLKQY